MKCTTVEGHEIKVGEKYVLRNGEVVTIKEILPEGRYCPVRADDEDADFWWLANGKEYDENKPEDRDLMRPYVEQVTEAPKVEFRDYQIAQLEQTASDEMTKILYGDEPQPEPVTAPSPTGTVTLTLDHLRTLLEAVMHAAKVGEYVSVRDAALLEMIELTRQHLSA